MKLLTLLQHIAHQPHNLTDREVEALAFDSRQVKPGTLFVAQRGTQTDGHNYIAKAIELGATAVVCETLP
ncbi:MAG: UDP-N-acetylmuramoyl-L-alanyl-D-glutamate--2,6-diaminopimelate ligase, partial [Bacteroidales bacterium]|nr:UDP-N-acetylmuramoyl-L-alanyl-D-glutamate--2,6-diaminopimelate ligase [Bacteroidales bacterium]